LRFDKLAAPVAFGLQPLDHRSKRVCQDGPIRSRKSSVPISMRHLPRR
jgi:hypothetical protein